MTEEQRLTVAGQKWALPACGLLFSHLDMTHFFLINLIFSQIWEKSLAIFPDNNKRSLLHDSH